MADRSPRLAANKSTNVRNSSTALARAFRLIGRIAPRLAAAAADRMFFTPPRPRRSKGDAMLRRGN